MNSNIEPSVLARFPGATPDQVAVYLQRADGRVNQAVALFESDQSRRRGGPIRSTNNNNGKQNEYFVGSGQAVVGRNPHLPDEGGAASSLPAHQEAINAVFEKAREQGPHDKSSDGNTTFTGSGRRLGHLEGPSPVIAPVRRRTVTLRIAFYENGFIVGDNTTLRSFDDDKGKHFCASINKGFIPRELVSEYGEDVDIDVNLEDRRAERYVPPRFVKFGGEGRSLAADPQQPNNNNNNVNNKNAPSGLVATAPPPVQTTVSVNPDHDTCTIAILNLMGKRCEFKVNPMIHTVMDLRVLAASTCGEPPINPMSFKLLVRDVPPRQLTDNSLTIDAAKLRNATVMMRG